MSFKSRAKKRKAKAQDKIKRQRAAGRWYLTIARRSSQCDHCTRALGRDEEFVYRHKPRAVLCVKCADAAFIAYRNSQRWKDRHSAQPAKRKTTLNREARYERQRRQEAERITKREAEVRRVKQRTAQRLEQPQEARDPKRSAPTPAELRLLATLGHTERPATQYDAQVLIRRLLDAQAETLK